MTRLKRRWWAALLLLIVSAPVFLHVSAQDTNLLQDPGFEGAFIDQVRTTDRVISLTAPWHIWFGNSPQNYDWQNRTDRVFAEKHTEPSEVHSGASSQQISQTYLTFTAAIYQQVSVQPNQNYTGSIWGRLRNCTGDLSKPTCGAAAGSGAYFKVGIDPTGGTDPNNPAIVWSGAISPFDAWQQVSVSATATGGTVTLFAFASQQWAMVINSVFFDDAALTGGGPGGGVPGAPASAPTQAPAQVATAFVAYAQPPRPDGSIIHVVQLGDTMTGISTAYGVPIDDIVQLNHLRSSRYIYVGQELLIKPADGSAASTQAVTAGGSQPVDLSADLFSQADLASLNPNPGPTPVGMSLDPAPSGFAG